MRASVCVDVNLWLHVHSVYPNASTTNDICIFLIVSHFNHAMVCGSGIGTKTVTFSQEKIFCRRTLSSKIMK